MLHHLNFKHLRYFMVVAQQGSISRAAESLHLTPQTISAQLKLLEQTLNTQLFNKEGRKLVLTPAGRQCLTYAEEIFAMGESLQDRLSGDHQALRLFTVGIVDVLPKLAAYRILEPALELDEPVHLECQEGSMERLLAELAINKIDMILTDRPVDTNYKVRAYNHALGESGISLFATPALAAQFKTNFPQSLDGAPMLMPTSDTSVGASLLHWFSSQGLRPKIIVDCVDRALLGTFGQAGKGIFCGPSLLEKEIEQQYHVEAIGQINDIYERFYAISLERRISHPVVLAITQQAKNNLFKGGDKGA